MYKAITISSGHGLKIRGASSKWLDEVDEARKVVECVAKHLRELGVTVNVFHDNTSTNQATNLKTIYTYHNSTKRDIDISVHFNAFNGTANGTEVLTYNSNTFGAKLSQVISDALGTSNRGNKVRKDLSVVNNTNKPCFLLEICFLDNAGDVDKYNKNFDKMCRALAETLSGKKLVEAPQKAPEKPQAGTKYKVVAGTYKERKNAEDALKKIKKHVDCYIESKDNKFRIIAGTFKEKANAQEQMNKLKKNNIDCFVVTE